MIQHINGSNSKNEVASNNDATCSGGRSSSPAFTHTSVGSKGINVNAEKKAVPAILPAPVQLAHRRRVRVVVGDGQSHRWFSRWRPVFGEKGRVNPRLCTRLACASKRFDEKTVLC